MAKKRKADATRLDEADRNLYANFRGAANSLSQLYSQTINQQRLSFHSGERHALEKLYQWILSQREEGSRVTTDDIIAYLQDEVDYGIDDTTPAFPSRLGNHHSQTVSQTSPLDVPVSCSVPTPANVEFDHQEKNSMFSSAPLPSHVYPNLQHYHLTDHNHYNNIHTSGSGNRPSSNVMHDQSQLDRHSSDDYTDMQTDVPGQKTAYRWFKQV
ncbi:unnamed protein product [Rhodiola kirilowii]